MQKYSKPTHNQFLQLVLSERLEYVHLNDIIIYYKHQLKRSFCYYYFTYMTVYYLHKY